MGTDIEKFMKGKPALTREDILRRLPREHRHQVEAFLPKNADELPPHRPWDHKIEIMPQRQEAVGQITALCYEEEKIYRAMDDDEVLLRPVNRMGSGNYMPSAKPILEVSNTRFRAQASCLDLVPKFLLYPWIHLLVSGLSFSNSGARLLRYRPLSSAAIDEESTCL